MAAAPWTALVLRVPAATEELLVGVLAWCLQGERRMDLAGGAGVELWLYLHSPADARAALEQAAALLERTGLSSEACGLRVETVEDGRWVERYQASLQPFDLGRNYRVFPSGLVDASGGDRRPLVLVPGRAFGTGEHPTTRLCAAALEERVEPGSRWADVGCGTAVLSIVARGCGAREVRALDDDPEAIEVAAEVLAVNSVEGIDVARGSAVDVAGGEWDGVVVNISAEFLIEHASTVASIPRVDGLVVASGFMEQDLDRVTGALGAAGLRDLESATDAPWGLAVFRRNG